MSHNSDTVDELIDFLDEAQTRVRSTLANAELNAAHSRFTGGSVGGNVKLAAESRRQIHNI